MASYGIMPFLIFNLEVFILEPVNLLSKEQFLQTMGNSMNKVTENLEFISDIWGYIDDIPEKGLISDTVLLEKSIYSVYVNSDKTYQHVLINTNRDNCFFVVVVDIIAKTIYGYYLLDLNEEYGLN